MTTEKEYPLELAQNFVNKLIKIGIVGPNVSKLAIVADFEGDGVLRILVDHVADIRLPEIVVKELTDAKAADKPEP